MKPCPLQCWVALGTTLFCLSESHYSVAQIVPDATLPVNSTVTRQGTTSAIEGGTRAGGNLFHSFREFSVPTGGEAFFNNAGDIQNIFSRVTGGSISNIDGLIRANGSANLFLLNPNGIIFGPNARLNIGGSFLASTASSIKFADGIEFSATNPSTSPLLTINVPIGLQYGSKQSLSASVQTPVAIVVQGSNLSVQTGKTLALVGGNVTIEGSNNFLASGIVAGGIPLAMVNGNLVPTTPGGRIELGSVTEDDVTLTHTDKGFALGYSGTQKFGDIQLTNGATVDTSGTGGGEIQIQARNLQLSSGSRIVSFTLGSLSGGDIIVNASDSVELIGTGGFVEILQRIASFESGLSDFRNGLFSISFGVGNAGKIKINTSRFIAENGAFIVTSTVGSGQGGSLSVNATDSVQVNNSGLISGNRPGSTGAAGDITINTRSLLFQNLGVAIAGTAGTGNGGNITVNASETAEFIGGENFPFLGVLVNTGLFTSTLSTADAGNIKITTLRLILQNWASIAAAVSGQGKGGKIEIDATESVEVIGIVGFLVAAIGASTIEGSPGMAGDLKINTTTLQLRDGSGIAVNNYGEGNAGNLNINARSIYLDNQAFLIANTRSANTDSNKDQATINLRSENLILRRGSTITTNARGENVIGGNININTNVLSALENSDISANSENFQGGKVRINSQAIFGTQFRNQPNPLTSDITATGGTPNLSGTVQINTPEIDPSAGLIELPQNIVDVTGLVTDKCSYVRRGSSFTVTGRGGIPPSPDDPLDPETFLVDLIAIDSQAQGNAGAGERVSRVENNNPSLASPATPDGEIVEATGWFFNEKGQVVLTASAQQVQPTSPWLTTPTCAPSVR